MIEYPAGVASGGKLFAQVGFDAHDFNLLADCSQSCVFC
jgi:hypothetical protein